MSEEVRWLPPEWAPQSAVLLTWPHRFSDWQPFLPEVEPVFVNIAREIALREQVIICCYDQLHIDHVHTLLTESGVNPEKVKLYPIPSNDSWARDHGPITVQRNGSPLLLDFHFNGWGRKYPYQLDDAINSELQALNAFGSTPVEKFNQVLEGGSIETDGEGTLLTTTQCQLSPQRNPELDCVGLEGMFQQKFGIERVLWLKHGQLEGDDTDGHIDTLARFCKPDTIAYTTCDLPSDPQHEGLKAMERELRQFRDHRGNPYRLIPLPLPKPVFSDVGRRLPATYANFLIINEAVLVPVYDDPHDEVVLTRLASAFPEREMVPINALPLIQQFGSLHCVTMQLPAGVV